MKGTSTRCCDAWTCHEASWNDPKGTALMQLKMTALMSTRLCVRDRPSGRRAAAHQVPHRPPHPSHSRKELTSWVRRPGDSLELSPERLAEAMDSGQVRTYELGRGMVGGVPELADLPATMFQT